MPSITRREVLAAATAGLAALAGCSGSDSSRRSVPGPRPEPVDYEVERVRDETGGVLFTRGEWTTDEERTPRRSGADYLTAEHDLERHTFAGSDEAQRLRAFAAETDFDAESVFLYAREIGACHEIHLRTVGIEDDGDPQLDFCRSTLPADVACSPEAVHTVGYAVRMAVDGESSSGYGTGMQGGCDRPSRPPTFDATVTVEEGSE